MKSEERKKKFALLLQELLEECGGVKVRLAEKLEIIPSRLTRWLQGKIDPAGLEILVFNHIAQVKGCSVDELAKLIGFVRVEKQSIDKFKALVEQMLSDKTQEELGKRLGVSQNTISSWLNPETTIDPRKIPALQCFLLLLKKNGHWRNC